MPLSMIGQLSLNMVNINFQTNVFMCVISHVHKCINLQKLEGKIWHIIGG